MLTGQALRAWARREAMRWWEARHEVTRIPLDEVIAEAYLHGGIAALRQETERLVAAGRVVRAVEARHEQTRQAVQEAGYVAPS